MADNRAGDNLLGREFSGYRLTRMVGRGGMGVIYAGVQTSLDRPVAVKVLYPHLSGDPLFRQRFEREARSAAKLTHPNIVRILDFGQEGSNFYIVMDLVEGESLRDRLARVHADGLTMRTSSVLTIIEKIGGALGHAHRLGYVHRDVKPGNILLSREGGIFLSDFGVVKALDHAQITAAGAIIGTPEYMSPEQSSGAPDVGPAADQYSLAVVAYEMLTGRVPFQANTPVGVLKMQISDPPPPPSTIVPWFPPAVEAVLMQALAKDPAQRYPTIDNFVAELSEAARQTPTGMGTATVASFPATPPNTSQLAGRVTPPPAQPQTAAGNTSYATSGPPPVVTPPTAASSQPEQSGRSLIAGIAVAALLILGFVGYFFVIQGGDDDNDVGGGGSVTATSSGATATTGGVALATETGTSATATVAVNPTATTGPVEKTPTEEPTPEPTTPPTSEPTPEPSPTATTPIGPPEGMQEVIIFASHRGDVHDSQIYIMNPDGSEQRQLTSSRGHSWGPRISPDGSKIIFSSVAPGEHDNHSTTGGGLSGAGNHDIYMIDSNGTNPVKLTTDTTWDNGWSWSPDGKWIAFTSDTGGNWDIYLMEVETREIVQVTDDPFEDGWPSWTPDGKRIVFASDQTGNWEIFSMNTDGSDLKQLTVMPDTYDTYPFVSPDGTKIVFSSQIEAANEGQIVIMNIDGSDPQTLTNSVALNYVPSFSPDGTKIVFASDVDGNHNIWVMNADGSDQRRLTDDPGEDTTPTWGYVPKG